MAFFKSDVQEALKKIEKGTFSGSGERDELLEVALQAENLKARDVVWMLFRPDRAVRQAGAKILSRAPTLKTLDLILEACEGKRGYL